MNENSLLVKALVFYGTKMHHRGQYRIHHSLRQLFKIDLNKEIEAKRGGHQWLLNPSDFVHSNLFWLGLYDYWDVYHLKKLVHKDSVFFDVGANFGYYSVVLGSLNPSIKIYSFEPYPSNLLKLQQHIRLNDLESVINACGVALSDNESTAVMSVREDNSGAATLGNPNGDHQEQVQVTTMDKFCKDNSIKRVDIIKIDVEGFEEKVLHGAEQLIRSQHPYIFIELDPPKLKRAGTSVQSLCNTLKDFGYNLYIAKRKTLVPLLDEELSNIDLINAFAFTPEQAALLEI